MVFIPCSCKLFSLHTKYNTQPNKNEKDVFGQGYIIGSIFIIFSVKTFSLSFGNWGRTTLEIFFCLHSILLKALFYESVHSLWKKWEIFVLNGCQPIWHKNYNFLAKYFYIWYKNSTTIICTMVLIDYETF